LDLKLQPANASHGMQIGLSLAAKTGNMQVGRIFLGVPAKKFAGRTDLRCLFRDFFASNMQTDGYFAVRGYLENLLKLL
jgi:hypothetical protein